MNLYLAKNWEGSSTDFIYLCSSHFSGTKKISSDIKRTENGKPIFTDDIGIYFSLSHSKEYLALAVHSDIVGLDIEVSEDTHGRNRLNWGKIASRFFDSGTKKPESLAEFLKTWVTKEASLKYYGDRLLPSLKKETDLNITFIESNYPLIIGIATEKSVKVDVFIVEGTDIRENAYGK